jgi:hypothetical protein
MKTAVIRKLNDIVSLTVLVLMAVALIAGQANVAGRSPGSDDLNLQVTSIRHNGE